MESRAEPSGFNVSSHSTFIAVIDCFFKCLEPAAALSTTLIEPGMRALPREPALDSYALAIEVWLSFGFWFDSKHDGMSLADGCF